jgi:hypothetical protein
MNTNSNGLRIVNPNNETLTINGSGTGDLQFGASVLANNFIFSHNIDSPSFNGVALTDAGSANLFLNEQGDYVTPGGGGNVSNTGTPVNNQLAVWTDTTTIEGDANLTFDTSTDTLDTVNITATNINLTGSTTLFQATLTDGTSLSTAIRGVASTGVNSRSGVSGDCVTSNSWGGIFSNSSDTYTTTCSLGGGTRIARFSYFSDSVEITKTGGITATGAITADSINTDDIVESTTDAGVTIEGLLLKDNTLSYSGSTQAVINISNDTGTSGQATAIIGTTAPTGQAIRATANGVNNVAGIFSNSSGTFTSSCSLGKGGTNMATFSYFTSSVNINTSGGITSTKGIDKLTHASGSVDVSAASAPTTGQVLTATSGTAATWQTPAVGKVVYAGSIVAAGAVISMANGQTGWSVSKTATGQYLVTHPLGTNNMTIIITSYTLNTTVAHNTPNSSNFTIYIRSVSTLGAVDAAVDFMVINKD